MARVERLLWQYGPGKGLWWQSVSVKRLLWQSAHVKGLRWQGIPELQEKRGSRITCYQSCVRLGHVAGFPSWNFIVVALLLGLRDRAVGRTPPGNPLEEKKKKKKKKKKSKSNFFF